MTKKTPLQSALLPVDYAQFITALKSKVRQAQVKAAVVVNRELIRLYWEIGKEIVEKQTQEGWGSKILEKVAKDLQNEFPGIEGFSRRNLFRMSAFYRAYAKVPQVIEASKKDSVLMDVLLDLVNHKEEQVNERSVSNRLKRFKNSIESGLRLETSGEQGGSALWRVVEI